MLAALIGVNIGPNLSYAGSLATLLWRRLLADRDQDVDLREFTRLGLATVPAGLAVATVALWAACGSPATADAGRLGLGQLPPNGLPRSRPVP